MAGISTQLTPEALALLEVIAGDESAGDYNVIYGGSKFSDYGDHPRQNILIERGPNKGKYSSAAGKYQFIKGTWDDIDSRYNLPDFSPRSQDMAAWALAQEEYKRDTGRSLQADLAAGDLSRVPASLRNQWTSLPGGIEQGAQANTFAKRFAANMGINLNAKPDLAAIDAALAGTGPLAGGGKAIPGTAATTAPTGVRQGAQVQNTDYMNALATRYLAGDFNDLGHFPGYSELSGNMKYQAKLPDIGPPGTPGKPVITASGKPPTAPGKGPGINLGGLFDGIGGALAGAGAKVGEIKDTVGDMAVAGGGALRNKINPLQAIAGVIAGKLGQDNGSQALRAAMGFANPNVGMTLGTASNGGTMVQGVNGVMNSTTQNSAAFQHALGNGSFRGPNHSDSVYRSGGDHDKNPAAEVGPVFAPINHDGTWYKPAVGMTLGRK